MENLWNIYSPFIMIASAIAIFIYALYLYIFKHTRQHSTNISYTILLLLVNAIWIIIYAITLINSNSVFQEICNYAIIFFITAVPIQWIFYSFHYTPQKSPHKLINIMCIVVLCILTIVVVTNKQHHFLWYTENDQRIFNPGYLIIIIFSIITIITGGLFLYKNLSLPFYIFRWQAFAILIAIMSPIFAIITEELTRFRFLHPVTLIPYSFIISAWIIRLTRTRFSVKDIIAISRASFFENTTDSILVLDKNDTIIDINPTATLLFQQQTYEVLNRPLVEVWPELYNDMQRIATENDLSNYAVYDHSNRKHFFDLEISPFLDWDSKKISKIITLHDITERKAAEENLRKSEEKFRNLIKQSIDGIIIIDESGCINEWNHGMEQATGIKKEAVINMPAWEMYTQYLYVNHKNPDELYNLKEKFLDALETGNASWLNKMAENSIIHTDGSIRTIQQQTFAIKTSKGFSLGSMVRDITEIKQLELERIKSGKLESLGILAGGIAHDFNNILTAIFGNLSMAKLFGNNEKLTRLILEAESACVQAKNLTLQLLTFAKGGEPICKTTSIIDIIEESSKFSLRGSNVQFELTITEGIWPVDVDIGQINQVISNLIINANQAMPNGGKIHICVSNFHLGSNELIPLNPGKYIKIAIIDEGSGIPEQNLQKIFDPYFTTKEKGSGLGLAITYNIIKRHNGYLSVDSVVGIGTTFTIYLKASEKEILPEIEANIESKNVIKLKILIMDDELGVRNILQQMLELIGHSSITTAEGSETIAVYKRALNDQEPFDLVIMDLTVPGGMGGKDTITKLLEIDVDTKAIVSSGYSNDPILANYKKYGFKGFLPKPYRLSDLENVLNSVVSS